MRPTGPRDDIQSPVFVIATVPDPTATHLRVEFDRTIDGIKDAAADDLFLFRRYWFPWPLEPARQFSDRASQDIEDSERAAKSRLPGLLLFDRLERGGHRSLVVLLAGESPTDGINRQQFDRAIKLKQKIEDLAKQADSAYQPGSTYYILGTTFSGSLHTLQLALREKRDPPMSHFKAISGTVSDGKSIDAFNQSFTSPEAPVHLRTLLHDTVTSLQAFRQYVYETWNYADPVAVLSETDTAFGALQGLNASGNPRDHEHFLLIPFPRDIAHLRNAYQSYPALSELGPANPDLRQSKNLPLPLEDTLNTVDSIPDYAAQTVVSQETMVSQIANRLRHDRIRFAAIIGTDVLDVLFLTRFLRSATPDTRLFLLDPDLLFVHAADALPFEGVLAVTTYPLLDGNPPFDIPAPPIGPAGASATDDRHWLFPTPFQQGIHNAMRVLLSDIVPGNQPALPGYEAVAQDQPPPLWITSVGRESYVPIAELSARLKPSAEPGLVRKPGTYPVQGFPRNPTRIWWLLFLAVTFAAVALAGVFVRAQKSRATWLNDFCIQGSQETRQQLSLFLVFTVGMYLVVLSTTRTRFLRQPVSLFFTIMGLAAIFTLLVIWWNGIHLRKSRLLPVLLVTASVVAVFALFLWLSHRSTDSEGVFFRFRSSELSAGAAPTIPFLFLFGGFLVYAFVSLQRGIFHHQRVQFVPRAKSDPVLGKNVWQLTGKLRRKLHSPFRRSRIVSTLLAVSVFLLCHHGLDESGLHSFEGPWYDTLFKIWASALVAVLAVDCGHFLEFWRLLSQMLEQLETHPLRRAFSALPPDHSWSPIWQSSPRKRSYLIVTRSIDALSALRLTFLRSPGRTALIDNARNRVGEILSSVARGERPTPAGYMAAQSALAATADSLVEYLQPIWKRGGSSILDEAKDGGNKHPDEQPPLVYAFEFVAMRYLAFIRYVMLQLRNLLTFLTLGFLAFAFALMSYPFQGERLTAWIITLVFSGITAVVVFVFAQMKMDPTLSRITNRDAGKLGFEFFHRALAFGALPLLTVLASNFNGVGRLLFSWIEPALKTLH